MSIVIQNANGKEMPAEIPIVTQGYLNPTLFRDDPSDVVGEFWIFTAIFLNDGSSLIEGYIDLSEPGNWVFQSRMRS